VASAVIMADRSRLPIPPTATPVTVPAPAASGVPTAAPYDARGVSHFPELATRPPTHNESVLLAGEPIAMASTNVKEIWFNGDPSLNPVGTGRLFCAFLDDSLYAFDRVPLAVAVGFIETDSPGRYHWNKIRDVYPMVGGGPLVPGRRGPGSRRPAQVVRLINK
jgi:hypothetical protein